MGDGINRFTSLFRGTSQGSTVKGNVQGTQKINQASYSNGTPELSEQGYQKYNIEDAGEIYISKVPERALFNEGEPVFVKAQPGVIVGMYRQVPVKEEEFVDEVRKSSRTLDEIFAGIERGSDLKVNTCFGTVVNGKVQVSEVKTVTTNAVSRSVERMTDDVAAVHGTTGNMACTGSAVEEPKIDLKANGYSTDNVEVKPIDKPRSRTKFVFKDGKLVQIKVDEPVVEQSPAADKTIQN